MSRGKKKTHPLLNYQRNTAPLVDQTIFLGKIGAVPTVTKDWQTMPPSAQLPITNPQPPDTVNKWYWQLLIALEKAKQPMAQWETDSFNGWVASTTPPFAKFLARLVNKIYGVDYSSKDLPIDDRIWLFAATLSYLSPPSARKLLVLASSKLNDDKDKSLDHQTNLYQYRYVIDLADHLLTAKLVDNCQQFKLGNPWEHYLMTHLDYAQKLIENRHQVLVKQREMLTELIDQRQTRDAYQLATSLLNCPYATQIIPNLLQITQKMKEIEYPMLYQK